MPIVKEGSSAFFGFSAICTRHRWRCRIFWTRRSAERIGNFLRDDSRGLRRKMAEFRPFCPGTEVVTHRPVTSLTEEDNQ